MATIQKWGNSLAVRIPATLAKQMHVKVGTTVELIAENDVLVMKPKKKRRQYRLRELLKDCRPRQLHGEVEYGPDVGREVLK